MMRAGGGEVGSEELLQRILNWIMGGVSALILCAFGAGAFFAVTNSEISRLNNGIEKLTSEMSGVKEALARDILPEAETRLDVIDEFRVNTSARLMLIDSRLKRIEQEN